MLHVRRHSLATKAEDGSRHLDQNGIFLAEREGGKDQMDVMFHGYLIRGAETVIAMASAMPVGPRSVPAIEGLGSQRLIDLIATAEVRALVAKGSDEWEAVLNVHGIEAAKAFTVKELFPAVEACFGEINEGETGTAITHSPFAQLTAWGIAGFPPLSDAPAELRGLRELEGFLIRRYRNITEVLIKIEVLNLTPDDLAKCMGRRPRKMS